MFCYQCEQTAKGAGCTTQGVCGKDSQTSDIQDLLIWQAKGISMYANRARKLGEKDKEIDIFIMEALFTTVTNVNFDAKKIAEIIKKGSAIKTKAKNLYIKACEKNSAQQETLTGAASWESPDLYEDMLKEALSIGIATRIKSEGADITGLKELLTYGLKGTAAYADHAQILGQEAEEVYAFFHEALDFMTKENATIDELLALNMKCGEINYKAMEILDTANTGTYGHPVPTKVRITPIKGRAILVSGHDLKDMEGILKQTEGKGINVYTHGEMLPTNGYPELKKYKHFIGNFGGAWQDQQKEFEQFPGAIIMTTNCMQKPRDSYKHRIFTTGLVRWPNVTHISGGDFSKPIEAALKEEGFKENGEEKYITVGFGHNTVLGIADKVIGAIKDGDIKHFFLMGGCDGAKPGRNYYTEFAQQAPKDSVILTLGCAKYRFNKLEFGNIGPIPRLLDIGQCNDSYSAIQIALALSKAFNVGVNELPLSMILSWYEQKAVCVLLTLLHLGIKNIRLGPSLPAFISPAALNVLVEKFNIMPITTAQEDLRAILEPATK